MAGNHDIDYKNNYFEYPELTRIHGEPKTASLIKIRNEMRTNAMTVPSELGGGTHGHLGLLCDAATYAAIPGTTPYIRPTTPGLLIIPAGRTQHQIAQQQTHHAERLRVFREANNVERTLLQQLVKALDEEYLSAIRCTITNRITLPIAQVITHLLDTYGEVSPTELQDL